MSKKASLPFGADLVLQLSLGAFFLAAGIMGITSYNSNVSGVLRFFGKNDTLNLVVSIVEIAMGAWLLIGIFAHVTGTLGQLLGYVLAGLWAVLIVMTYVINNPPTSPHFIEWLSQLSRDLVILVSLWIVGKRIATR